MSKVPLKNVKGDSVGDYDVADTLLIQDKGNQAVHEAVVAHLAHQRAGTASTKSKSEVAGSGRSRGSRRARVGRVRVISSLRFGGGVLWRMVRNRGSIRKKFRRRWLSWLSGVRLVRRWLRKRLR